MAIPVVAEKGVLIPHPGRKGGQLSAAVAAIKEMGVLSGQRIERREIGAPGEFGALNDDELERALVERSARWI
ncbi:MAG: hypothetical protein WB689_09130 [Xanthobacteraceae bacterium]